PPWFRRSEDTFVGRDEYLTEIEAKLQDGQRLVLLHGEGGIGKTRLALQIGRRMDAHFGGRIFGVPFDGLAERDPAKVTSEQVAKEIARALLAPMDLVEKADAASLADYLNRRFPDQSVLLVLDNFESANNGATRKLLGDLLKDTPQLRCLVTCRMHFSLAPYGYDI